MRKGNWKNIENWHTGLQKGMTKQQVRELMGEPKKIEAYTMLGEDWLYGYQGSGEIHFSPKGVLESWKEPIPDDLK
jgi:outer membrane protein assembly factor BamE (lipoprotein component of BamABCDE complex)